MRRLRRRFHELAGELQDETQRAVGTHLDAIHGTFEMLRDENVALESERDQPFRDRVAAEVGRVQLEISHIKDVVTEMAE